MKGKLLIIVALSLFLSSRTFAKDKVVTFCEDPFPPYAIGKQGLPPTGGISVEILINIFERIDGYEASFMLEPWKRCLRSIKIGKTDGYMQGIYNKERAEYLVVSDPFELAASKLYYLKSRYHPATSASPLTIGAGPSGRNATAA